MTETAGQKILTFEIVLLKKAHIEQFMINELYSQGASAAQGRGLQEKDPVTRRKIDPEKLEIAARLRRETTLTIKYIAAIVHLGSSKSANANLHRHMRKDEKRTSKSMTQHSHHDDRTKLGVDPFDDVPDDKSNLKEPDNPDWPE